MTERDELLALLREEREELRALLQEARELAKQGEPVAWLSKRHDGSDLTISAQELQLQPAYIKELWKGAQPLYTAQNAAPRSEGTQEQAPPPVAGPESKAPSRPAEAAAPLAKE